MKETPHLPETDDELVARLRELIAATAADATRVIRSSDLPKVISARQQRQQQIFDLLDSLKKTNPDLFVTLGSENSQLTILKQPYREKEEGRDTDYYTVLTSPEIMTTEDDPQALHNMGIFELRIQDPGDSTDHARRPAVHFATRETFVRVLENPYSDEPPGYDPAEESITISTSPLSKLVREKVNGQYLPETEIQVFNYPNTERINAALDNSLHPSLQLN